MCTSYFPTAEVTSLQFYNYFLLLLKKNNGIQRLKTEYSSSDFVYYSFRLLYLHCILGGRKPQ